MYPDLLVLYRFIIKQVSVLFIGNLVAVVTEQFNLQEYLSLYKFKDIELEHKLFILYIFFLYKIINRR